ncbi:MAG: phenylacetate--CoA ligase [Alphaproteobacteria bacterium]|nr:phenylacetate--CoA ligase [Alphaproteobacteria bacterium]
MANGDYYNDLEIRDPAARERQQFAEFGEIFTAGRERASALAALLKDIDPRDVTNRDQLAGLPVTRKSELVDLQKSDLPFGGFTAVQPGDLARIFCSPGPIFDPEGKRADYWRVAQALFAADFRPGEVVHNCYAYHLTPAGSMMETGAHALGCAVVPGGVGNTELQVAAIQDIRPAGYAGTPSFLKIVLEKGKEMGADLSSLTKSLVGAEPLPPSLRKDIEAFGVRCRQIYASADLGNMAFESEALDGMIVAEGIIMEIVRPGTGDPVAEGEVGEIVVTALCPEYPLLRFGTGDMSATLTGPSPCGRTNMRIKGWMGRADQSTKVKGMFVRPGMIADIARRHPEILKARLEVDRDDVTDKMTLSCEVADGGEGLVPAITESLQAVTKMKGVVTLCEPGSLPNDGKVIDDVRKFDE